MTKGNKYSNTSKSPKAKHAMKREAEKNERKAKRSNCDAESVRELIER